MNITFENNMTINYTGKREIKAAWIAVSKKTGNIILKGYSMTKKQAEKNALDNLDYSCGRTRNTKHISIGRGFRQKLTAEETAQQIEHNKKVAEGMNEFDIFVTEVA